MYGNQLYLVAGGDSRYLHLANLLTERGKVCTIGFDSGSELSEHVERLSTLSQLKDAPDVLILPMPVTRNGITLHTPLGREKILLSHVLDVCHKNTLVLGGKADEKVLLACEERGLQFADYLEREEFAILNAVPTAEGALQIAMEELPVALSGQRVLITGYGKVAKICHRVFAGAGAQVTISARSCRDLAWAEAYGAHVLPLGCMKRMLPKYRVIINTVPARIFGEEELSMLDSDTLLIDLASAPGGIDYAAAEELGLRAILALSLPGKVAPLTAASIIDRTIGNILTERGCEYE
jgi:dipicolinate synthase subunit A